MSLKFNNRGIAAAAMAAALTFAPTSAFAADGGSDSETETFASVESSIVHLQMEWSGYVLYEGEDGWEWSDEVTTISSCTGFFVGDSGEIVTAGHCLEEAGRSAQIIDQFVYELYLDGEITDGQYEDVLDTALSTWSVEGYEAGSPIERKVWVYQPEAFEDRILEKDKVAQVLDFQGFDEGDVALVKIAVDGTPALSLAEADPKTGAEVTSVGFPGSVGDLSSDDVRASFKSGTVSSQQVMDNGLSVTEINADVDFGMSGGPTIDAEGNVLGVNSFGVDANDAFNFITDTSDLGDWLERQGIDVTYGGTSTGTDGGASSEKAGASDRAGSDSEAKPASDRSPVSSSREQADPLIGILLAGGIGGVLLLIGGAVLTVVLVRRSGTARTARVATPLQPAPVAPVAGPEVRPQAEAPQHQPV